MNCQRCQNILDELLVDAPSDADYAEMQGHVAICTDCAREHRLAGQTLVALAVSHPVHTTLELRERILREAASLAAGEENQEVTRGWTWSGVRRSKLAMAVAASLLAAGAMLLWRGPEEGPRELPAFTLVSQAYAAERMIFSTGGIIHIVNEIVVKPIADAELARTRWFPIMSLEARGKPRFHQLTLSAKSDEGYTVTDECWHETTTGRFVRQMTVEGRPIYGNAFDGEAIYWLDVSANAAPRVEKRATGSGFRPPENPERLLGIAAGLPARIDEKDKRFVTDAGEVRLDDGTTGRKVKVGFPELAADKPVNAYVLFTIRQDDHTIARIEFVVDGKSLYEVRRVKTETMAEGEVAWDLAGLAKEAAEPSPAPQASITPDMVIGDVSVKNMVEKASFATYIFQSDPPWAGERQITDILDIVSPPNRMFAITYRGKDGRHVVLIQSASYNNLLAPLAKLANVAYTSPGGVKVLSGGRERDQWLAGILLQSSRATIKDPPSNDRTGYLLQTPDGTYPALAVNGQLTEDELHELIDSLVPAKAAE